MLSAAILPCIACRQIALDNAPYPPTIAAVVWLLLFHVITAAFAINPLLWGYFKLSSTVVFNHTPLSPMSIVTNTPQTQKRLVLNSISKLEKATWVLLGKLQLYANLDKLIAG